MLDGLRGVAAITVMLYHAGVTFGIPTAFSRGYLFVDFFFLLSGFVLTLSGEHKMNQAGGITTFLRARTIRLWPLTAVGTLAGAAGPLITGGHDGVALAVVLALLMIPSVLGSGLLFPLNGPQWSLFLELVANVFHGAVLRRLDSRQLRVAVLVSALALASTIMLFGSNTLGPFAFNWWWALPRVAFSYILGVWLARQWMTGPRLPVLSWQWTLTLPIICVIAVPHLPLTQAFGDMLLTFVLFPTLFWAAVLAPLPPKAEPWLCRLGALSFPLYAVHLQILQGVVHIDSSVSSMLLAITAAITVAWLIDRMMTAFSAKRSKPDTVKHAPQLT